MVSPLSRIGLGAMRMADIQQGSRHDNMPR